MTSEEEWGLVILREAFYEQRQKGIVIGLCIGCLIGVVVQAVLFLVRMA